MASLSGPRSTTAAYFNPYDGGDVIATELTLELTAQENTVSYTIQRATDPAGNATCAIQLELQASLSFVTSDGTFREMFPGSLVATKDGEQFGGGVPVNMFRGTYDVSRAGRSYRDPYLEVGCQLAPSLSGDISVYGTDPDFSDNTSVYPNLIAMWPAGGAS